MVILRDYQLAAQKAVHTAMEKGINKQVIVLATGTGKTIIFSHIIADRIKETGKKALVIAHREELLLQAKDKLSRVEPDLYTEVEMASSHATPLANVIVASVATLGRANSSRKDKFDPNDFCVVVIDEAHHAAADSYKEILRYFGLLMEEPENDWNKNCLLLGVTATPNRADNKELKTIFQQTTFSYTIQQGMSANHLARIRAFRVNTATNLQGVHNTAGDFNLGELGDAVNNDDRNGLIIKAYKTLTPDKQAICFAVDVAHTQELSKRFNDEGIPSEFVLGATPKLEREQILKDFKDHKIKVLVNAMVLTEGYDEESIQAVLMARPTQSGILYQQMVGRGTRIHPQKEFLTVIDFVDNSLKHQLKTATSLLDIPGNVDFKGKDILDMKPKLDQLIELAPNINMDKVDLDKINYILEEVDLMSGLEVPDEISVFSKFDWQRYDIDVYRLYLANGHFLTIRKDITDRYSVSDEEFNTVTKKPELKAQTNNIKDLDIAVRLADSFVEKKFPDQVAIVATAARWRKTPASEAQLNYLRMSFKVSPTVLDQLDKGGASRLIGKLKSQKQRGLTL